MSAIELLESLNYKYICGSIGLQLREAYVPPLTLLHVKVPGVEGQGQCEAFDAGLCLSGWPSTRSLAGRIHKCS